jgi:hypothetical protein
MPRLMHAIRPVGILSLVFLCSCGGATATRTVKPLKDDKPDPNYVPVMGGGGSRGGSNQLDRTVDETKRKQEENQQRMMQALQAGQHR